MNKEGYTDSEIIRKLELENRDLRDMVKFHVLRCKKLFEELAKKS